MNIKLLLPLAKSVEIGFYVDMQVYLSSLLYLYTQIILRLFLQKESMKLL